MFRTLIASVVLAAAVATTGIAAPALSSAAANNGPASGPMQADNAFGSDMSVVHEMLADHNKIKRTVTNLPNGIRTVTESDDPQVAKEIKAHVASMDQRLKDGKVFNVASHTLPTIFANNAKIHTEIQQTANGVILTQTSSDPTTVAALQAHAGEVSDLAREGMVALQRSVMANGGPMGSGGPMMHGGTSQGHMGPGMMGRQGMMNGGGPMMMAQMRQMMMQGGGPMGNMQGHTPSIMQGQGPQNGPPAQTAP
jgi:hypothetical protein